MSSSGGETTGDFQAELMDELCRIQARGQGFEPQLLAQRFGVSMSLVQCSWSALQAVHRAKGRRPHSDRLPPTLAHFHLRNLLGHGGAGVVFRAWDSWADRDVALKILTGRSSTHRLRARFRREGEITASLSHPGIVRIHSTGEAEGFLYLAYQLVEECQTLRDVFGISDTDRSLRLMLQVCSALGYAHARGVVHRDVKPSNVLVDGHGRARVADFGLSIVRGQTRITRTGGWLGTAAYLPPEWLGGSSAGGLAQPSPSGDVWSLGIMLYEVLSGRHPCEREDGAPLTWAEYRDLVRSARFPRLGSIAPQVPRELEQICQRALQPFPGERFRDASEMGCQLQRSLLTRGVLA